MPRYKLTIAYDGTDFCGWQKQFPHADAVTDSPRMEGDDEFSASEVSSDPGGAGVPPASSPLDHAATSTPPADPDRPRVELRTVQAVVERAVRLVVQQPVVIYGASRTDSGVHARGQVAAFSTVVEEDQRGRGGWPIERGTAGLMRAINSRLPHDVLVRSAEVVPDDFNPITGGGGRTVTKGYSYTIWNAPERTLWGRRTSLHVWQRLDAGLMRAAAAELVGEHDFAAFAAAGHGRATTVRTVFECDVVEGTSESSEQVWGADPAVERSDSDSSSARLEGLAGRSAAGWTVPGDGRGLTESRMITIRVSGNGFLWNMVRIIAGTLIEAGKGRLDAERVRQALATGDRRLAGPTVPGHGLCLEWISYR